MYLPMDLYCVRAILAIRMCSNFYFHKWPGYRVLYVYISELPWGYTLGVLSGDLPIT